MEEEASPDTGQSGAFADMTQLAYLSFLPAVYEVDDGKGMSIGPPVTPTGEPSIYHRSTELAGTSFNSDPIVWRISV
ncbi:hypothetical protein DSL72_002374 [Monilinia vaccinii-corymbosi]|uniref:Uncharacterized protein n=1 Tax=Monilinia vaccinii-corymbosi TaxID=61207 RepID=A0A8A3PCG6_9HELO|nr:hypothetical protein DSL72_002374 [Monilinia vaccinii-corymbosi]